MSQKIYDIFPPNNKKDFISHKKENKKVFILFNSLNRKKLLMVLFFIIPIIVFSFYSLFLGVDIIIWPETKEIFYDDLVEVNMESFHHDIELGIIPGKTIVMQKNISKNFLSSGTEVEEKKAEGLLTIYNNHSAQSQTLVAETRFMSSDGKLFRSTERVVIPGRTQDGGRFIPGEASVIVRAVESGEDYNLDKNTKFSIPGLQGTVMYTSIHAENNEPITGGFMGSFKKVTEKDVKEAKEVIMLEIINETEKDINDSSEGFIFEEELVDIIITEESVSPEIGERNDGFTYSLKAEVRVSSFKESDLIKFLEGFFFSRIKEEKDVFINRLYKESLTFTYKPEIKINRSNNFDISVESSVFYYPSIIDELIKKKISGKKINEARIIFSDYEEIEKMEINSWPSWIKKIPNTKRIKIKTIIDL
jgi:hypothetical protein